VWPLISGWGSREKKSLMPWHRLTSITNEQMYSNGRVRTSRCRYVRIVELRTMSVFRIAIEVAKPTSLQSDHRFVVGSHVQIVNRTILPKIGHIGKYLLPDHIICGNVEEMPS
jgi:hypothetical protein